MQYFQEKNKTIRKEDFHRNPKPIYTSVNQHVPDLPPARVQFLSAGEAEGQSTGSRPWCEA